MDKHQAEIDRGRVVRGYASQNVVSAWDKPDLCSTNFSPQHSAAFDVPILIVLPPKPLEIEGWVCDGWPPQEPVESAFCLSTKGCLNECQSERDAVNCRKVVLVEKNPT